MEKLLQRFNETAEPGLHVAGEWEGISKFGMLQDEIP
jgi:hypothetical protein